MVDIRTEKTAVLEAKSVGIKVFALCDTNVNPAPVDYVIPSNDDAVKTIELMCKVVCETVKEGKAEAAKPLRLSRLNLNQRKVFPNLAYFHMFIDAKLVAQLREMTAPV